jgi:hypothetical protein
MGLENLELFDPATPENYWDEFLQQSTHRTSKDQRTDWE